MTSAPANPIHVQLARELGIPWPPMQPRVPIELGPTKADRHAERNAGWRQTGEVIDFPMSAMDQQIGDGRARL